MKFFTISQRKCENVNFLHESCNSGYLSVKYTLKGMLKNKDLKVIQNFQWIKSNKNKKTL